MKKFLILIFTIIVLDSCEVQKYLAISDGSKSDGTLTMVYEHGVYEKPVVHWEEAKQSAAEKCQSWGYGGAEFFDVGEKECISRDANGNCLRFRVTYKCQCTD